MMIKLIEVWPKLGRYISPPAWCCPSVSSMEPRWRCTVLLSAVPGAPRLRHHDSSLRQVWTTVTHAGLSLVTCRPALGSHWSVLAGVAALLPGPAFFVRILAAAGPWLPACSARLTSLVGKWRKLTRDWRVWWKLSRLLLLSPPPGHSGAPGHLTDAATAPLVSRLPLCSYSRWNLIKYEQNLLRAAPGGHHTQSQDTTPANTSHQITTENRDLKHIIKVRIKEDVDMFALVLSRSSHYRSNIQNNGSIWEMS